MNKKRQINISKTLSWLLRHGGEKEGLLFRDDGYTDLLNLLENKNMANQNVTIEEIENIVASNDKQRFVLSKDSGTGRTFIKATQGHSMNFSQMNYKKIKDAKELDIAVHGTYYDAWEIIKNDGLRTMGRTHIHFAKGEPDKDGVISGMRNNSQVYIYLNIEKCLESDVELEVSENGVILTKGEGGSGLLPTKYFLKVIDAKTGKKIF